MAVAKTIKQLEKKLNLKKKYPLLFTRTTTIILNVAIIVCIALIFLSAYLDGANTVYIECPASTRGCNNPLFDQFCYLTHTPCEKAFLYPGETIGEKPSLLTQNLSDIIVLIIGLSFLLNYFLYVRRLKSGKFHN